jgi:hypothetical protein
MRLRPHRQNLVVLSRSTAPPDRCATSRHTRIRRIRRRLRITWLLALVGLVRLSYPVRARWRPLLAGAVLTAAGLLLRGGWGSIMLLPGLTILVASPLTEGSPKPERLRRSKLERELAVYSTPAQRLDLEATLDRYPDTLTRELRDILARQAIAAGAKQSPAGTRAARY